MNITVTIWLSDPWELGEALQWRGLSGEIIGWSGSHEDAVLIRLAEPFVFGGVNCEYFVASPRYEGRHMSEVRSGQSVVCGLTRIPEERVRSADPFDLSWWHGGVGVLATVEPC